MRGQFHHLPIAKISKPSFVGGNRFLSVAVNSAARDVAVWATNGTFGLGTDIGCRVAGRQEAAASLHDRVTDGEKRL
jgi:hypothetical protein